MTTSSSLGSDPVEAVLSHHWDGHRLLYVEAILLEATRQGRRLLVILDETARHAPDWQRIEESLGSHELLTTDLTTVALEQAVPASVTRLIVLEADLMLREAPSLLRKMPELHLVLLIMREPGLTGLVTERRTVAVTAAKMGLITLLTTRYGSRCNVHILRSPLFRPSRHTQLLVAGRRCVTILDPVLKSGTSGITPGPGRSKAEPPTALVVGRLDRRKSIAALFATWADPALQDYRLALRGEVDHKDFDELLTTAVSKGADILVENRHLTDDELAIALTEATAVFCLYNSSLPSGIAALAIDAGCPVIGLADTRLGQAVADHRLGSTIDAIDGSQIAAAIARCQAISRLEIRDKARLIHERATTQHFSRQLLGALAD